MPDKKLVDLSTLADVAPGDYLHVLDVSDTTMSAEGSDKKIAAQDVVSTALLGSGTAGGSTALLGDRTWGTPGTKWLSLPRGWDDTWRAALAASATTPALVSFVGDSFAQGYVASNWLSLGFAGRIATSLKSSYGTYGDFYPTTESQSWVTTAGGGYTYGGTPPWVMAGGTISWFFGFGLTKTPFWAASALTNLATFTTPYACTKIDILHFDYVAGTFQYTVDGGSAVTVTCTGNGTRKRISLTGLSNTTHTLTFGVPSALNALGLIGVATYAGTTGIGVARLAYGVGKAADYTFAVQGNNANTVGSVYTWQGLAGFAGPGNTNPGLGFPSAAHLVVLSIGANDTTADLLRDNLGGIVTGIRRGRSDASILVVAQHFPNVASDSTATVALAAWPSYVAAMASLAAGHGCGFASVQGRWGGTSFASGFVSATNQHPTDAGHADIADLLDDAIL